MTGWNEKGVFFTRKWTIAGEFTGKNTGKRAEGPPPEAADYSRVRVETLGAARFLRSCISNRSAIAWRRRLSAAPNSRWWVAMSSRKLA